jgi:hypothetical protein
MLSRLAVFQLVEQRQKANLMCFRWPVAAENQSGAHSELCNVAAIDCEQFTVKCDKIMVNQVGYERF